MDTLDKKTPEIKAFLDTKRGSQLDLTDETPQTAAIETTAKAAEAVETLDSLAELKDSTTDSAPESF